MQIWCQFHTTWLNTLCDIWKSFLDALNCEFDPLVQQYVNQELYSGIIKVRCASGPTKVSSILKEEENVVRYAAGYVPFTLLKKHERSLAETAAFFVECLSGMAINGEESSFLEYTAEWIRKVNGVGGVCLK